MELSNLEIKGNVYFIETMGAFDGPGLRYVLFLQGCPLRCKFCHNRDSWSTDINRLMTVEEVLNDYERYKTYYKRGGITVSGGEPTMQIDFVTALFKECRARGIHTCLDTSAGLYSKASRDKHIELLKYTDLVLLDIKHIDDASHKWLVGGSNKQILEFAKLLDETGNDTVIRHVLVPTINDSDEFLIKLRDFLDTLTNVVGIDVLPYHNFGTRKWEKVGAKYELGHIPEPGKDLIHKAEHILKDNYKFKKVA